MTDDEKLQKIFSKDNDALKIIRILQEVAEITHKTYAVITTKDLPNTSCYTENGVLVLGVTPNNHLI